MILINEEEEGPYSIVQLRADRRITPQTLVRRIGTRKWRAIGSVKELRAVFEDEEIREEPKKQTVTPGGALAILNPSDPEGPFAIVIFVILLAGAWILYNILLRR